MAYVAVLLLVWVASAQAGIVTTFESGGLEGWMLAVVPNGTIGASGIVSFDTDGDGADSLALRFQSGLATPVPYSSLGGGYILKTFNAEYGILNFSVELACFNPADTEDPDGARIAVFFDGDFMGAHEFGTLAPHSTERAKIEFSRSTYFSGQHRLVISVHRREVGSSTTPYQFIDNIKLSGPAVDGSPVPEPASIVMLSLGGTGIGLAAWRRRRLAVA